MVPLFLGESSCSNLFQEFDLRLYNLTSNSNSLTRLDKYNLQPSILYNHHFVDHIRMQIVEIKLVENLTYKTTLKLNSQKYSH